jgi:hypothetical protein
MSTIQDVIDAMAKLDEQIKSVGQEAIVEQANKVFEAFPDAKRIIWDQYTPYFNDGAPCEFMVNEIYLDLGKFTPKQIEEQSLCYAEYADDPFSLAYDQFPNDRDKRDALYTEIKTKLTPLTSIPCEIMLKVFGDHVDVTINRDGTVEVEHCDHD